MKYNSVTVGMGVLFVFLGMLIAISAENDALSYLTASGIGGLGIEAIYSGIRNRRSLLSRIGPLP